MHDIIQAAFGWTDSHLFEIVIDGTDPDLAARGAGRFAVSGTCRGPVTVWIDGPQGLPLVKPLWGRITAIAVNTGELLDGAERAGSARPHLRCGLARRPGDVDPRAAAARRSAASWQLSSVDIQNRPIVDG